MTGSPADGAGARLLALADRARELAPALAALASRRPSLERVVVVGAGLAGLSAALTLADREVEVLVLEASPHLGGRCRSYEDPELGLLDNGTHALTAANPAALTLLDRLGARSRWHRPPDGALPLVDLASGEVLALRPRLADFAALGLRPRHALDLVGPDRPVASLFDTASPVYRRFVEPLTVAALNTAPEVASSRLLRRVLLEGWRGPGALIPLVAETGLGPDLVEPLAREIVRRGGAIETSTRVRRLVWAGERVASVDLGEETIDLGERDGVVLALPPPETERLAGLDFGFSYSPIVNAHFDWTDGGPAAPRMIGVVGAATQWILLRHDIASVTVSAADALAAEPADAVADRLWQEVKAALGMLGYDPPAEPRAQRIVKERRATIRQTVGLDRPGPATAWPNLFLAGDWTDTGLPATIEGAVRSGRKAARAAGRPPAMQALVTRLRPGSRPRPHDVRPSPP